MNIEQYCVATLKRKFIVKNRRNLKRITRRDAWRLRGVKKNGQPVAKE